MVVGTLEVALRLEGCQSLKDKRQILRSLVEKIRREFQVAVAEVDDNDLWGNAVIGVAAVSNSTQHVESVLEHVLAAFDQSASLEVEGVDKQVERR